MTQSMGRPAAQLGPLGQTLRICPSGALHLVKKQNNMEV